MLVYNEIIYLLLMENKWIEIISQNLVLKIYLKTNFLNFKYTSKYEGFKCNVYQCSKDSCEYKFMNVYKDDENNYFSSGFHSHDLEMAMDCQIQVALIDLLNKGILLEKSHIK